MKRVLTILAILLLPLSVWAMTPVSDSDLSNVTGQAGVNINADLTMDITIGTMSWGDKTGLDSVFGWDAPEELLLVLYSKGITGTGIPTNAAGVAAIVGTYYVDKGGYVGVTGFNITNLRIRARVESTDNYNGYSLTSHTPGGNHLKPITIDVATDAVGEFYGAGITFVRIGLGSLQISMDDLQFNVALGATGDLGDFNAGTGQRLGEVYIGGLNMYINANSYVDIFNARGAGMSGVTMNLNFILDRIALEAISWGDTDGTVNSIAGSSSNYDWYTASDAGYVGLNNISIGVIEVTGAINIDVATATAGEYITAAKAFYDDVAAGVLPTTITLPASLGGATMPTAYLLRPSSTTIVHFTFGRGTTPFTIDVTGPITADVQLSNLNDLSGFANTKSLGDIYISGFKMDIKAGSWVDIWAH